MLSDLSFHVDTEVLEATSDLFNVNAALERVLIMLVLEAGDELVLVGEEIRAHV